MADPLRALKIGYPMVARPREAHGWECVATWDASTTMWQWEHWSEACQWAMAHGAGDDTWRYEIWIMDGPLARILDYAADERGRRYISAADGEVAQAPVRVVPLDELPPEHLRALADVWGRPRPRLARHFRDWVDTTE